MTDILTAPTQAYPIVPQPEAVAPHVSFREQTDFYRPLVGDEQYIPTLGEYHELGIMSSEIHDLPVSMNWEGDITRGFVGPENTRVEDSLAYGIREKADPKHWVQDTVTEQLWAKAALYLDQEPTAARGRRGRAQQAEADQDLIRAEAKLHAFLQPQEGTSLSINSDMLQRLVALSQESRRQLRRQGVDVDGLLRERSKVSAVALVPDAQLTRPSNYYKSGRAAVQVDGGYREKPRLETREDKLAYLLSSKDIKTARDVAVALFPEYAIGGSRVTGRRAGLFFQRRAERKDAREGLPLRYAPTPEVRREIDGYVKQIVAVRGLQKQAKGYARDAWLDFRMDDYDAAADAAAQPKRAYGIPKHAVAHALYSEDGKRELTDAQQRVVDLVSDQIHETQFLEATRRGWRRFTTVELPANIWERVTSLAKAMHPETRRERSAVNIGPIAIAKIVSLIPSKLRA